MRTMHTLRLGLLSLGLAVALFLTAAVLGTRGAREPSTPPSHQPSSSPSEIANPGDLASLISSLQARLTRLPSDAGSWATLGSAYIQQARVTGDPSYYFKASGALQRSLKEQPSRNSEALTGEAALAAGRHDFGQALRLARRSQRIDPYSSVNEGMLVDALVELGRYRAATAAVQRMVDLKPAVPSYTRVSYIFELKGDLKGARFAMRRAFEIAYSADDKGFALFQLGELAWNSGRLKAAGRLYSEGRRLDPGYLPLLYGRAKVEAAEGRTADAVRDYQTVVDRYPSAAYLSEYIDLLNSLGRAADARRQEVLVRAQERIFRAAGVNLDLELALYDANHGRPVKALQSARRAFTERKSVFVEDAYAWALHVNGRDHLALRHSRHASRIGTRSALFAFHRGMIEKSLGLRRAAAGSLHQALAINPYFSPLFAPQARAVLDRLKGVQGP
jgi:tetratricopeptide (TPR) repeat protein